MAWKYSVRSLLSRLAHHGIPQMLGTICGLAGVLLGTTLILVPDTYRESFTLANIFLYVSPFAWGTIYIIAALVLLVSVHVDPKLAQLPAFMLGLVFAVYGFLTIPRILDGGIPQSAIFSIGFAWVCIATQLICGVTRGKANEETFIYHKP